MKISQNMTPAYRSNRDRDAKVAAAVEGIEPSFLPGAKTVCKWGCGHLDGVAKTICLTGCELL